MTRVFVIYGDINHIDRTPVTIAKMSQLSLFVSDYCTQYYYITFL